MRDKVKGQIKMIRPKIGFKRIPCEREGLRGPKYAQWNGEQMRAPKKGEYFMSGASGYEMAYLAKNDMTSEYFIAVPCKE
jgi:hypothetical protein